MSTKKPKASKSKAPKALDPFEARYAILLARRVSLDAIEIGRAYVIHARRGSVGVAVYDEDERQIGTKEQLATLLRVTIAEGLRCAILLDDHLVQSDPVRLAWFRKLLRAAAERTQVLVFTCKPDDYLEDGDDADGRVRGIDLRPLVKRIPFRAPRVRSDR